MPPRGENFRMLVANSELPDPPEEILGGREDAKLLFSQYVRMLSPVDLLQEGVVGNIARGSLRQADADVAYGKSAAEDHLQVTRRGLKTSAWLTIAKTLEQSAGWYLRKAGIDSGERARTLSLRGLAAAAIAAQTDSAGPPMLEGNRLEADDQDGSDLLAAPMPSFATSARNRQLLRKREPVPSYETDYQKGRTQ